MTGQHSQTFFGQKTSLIINSNAVDDPFIFIRCIKKKKNGDWEKYDEGKVVKLSLLELISITDVLHVNRKIWNTFHSYNQIKTPISFAWDESDSDLLWINIDNYCRPLNYPQTELLRRLLDHILDEKISYSTIRKEKIEEKKDMYSPDSTTLNKDNRQRRSNFGDQNQERKNFNDFISNSNNSERRNSNRKNNSSDTTQISGRIKCIREKALLLALENNEEIWLPKSTIMNNYFEELEKNQKFLIKNWILEKRDMVISSS